MKITHYAERASAHRVHAGYAKADRANSTWSIAFWAVTTVAFICLAAMNPGIGKFTLTFIGVLGIALATSARHEAGKRYARHIAEANKFQQIADDIKENR